VSISGKGLESGRTLREYVQSTVAPGVWDESVWDPHESIGLDELITNMGSYVRLVQLPHTIPTDYPFTTYLPVVLLQIHSDPHMPHATHQVYILYHLLAMRQIQSHPQEMHQLHQVSPITAGDSEFPEIESSIGHHMLVSPH